eukprot:2659086-Prymnesium_polylepis.1
MGDRNKDSAGRTQRRVLQWAGRGSRMRHRAVLGLDPVLRSSSSASGLSSSVHHQLVISQSSAHHGAPQ